MSTLGHDVTIIEREERILKELQLPPHLSISRNSIKKWSKDISINKRGRTLEKEGESAARALMMALK